MLYSDDEVDVHTRGDGHNRWTTLLHGNATYMPAVRKCEKICEKCEKNMKTTKNEYIDVHSHCAFNGDCVCLCSFVFAGMQQGEHRVTFEWRVSVTADLYCTCTR